jgi:superfamily II DNA or RNA helicase
MLYVIIEFIKNLVCFDEIYPIFTQLDKKQKGDLFETITYYLFKLSPVLSQGLEKIWMYDQIPEKIRTKLLLPEKDKGIDLLIRRNRQYEAVQCKWRQDCETTIPWNELATFFGLSFGLHNKIKHGYFVTNTFDMCKEVEKSKKVNKIATGSFFDENLPDNFFKNMYRMYMDENVKIVYKKKSPFPYQLECIEACKKYFNAYPDHTYNIRNPVIDMSRGFINLACGTGKSIIAYWIIKALVALYGSILALVPSLQLLSQFYIDLINESHAEGKTINYILIGSDADIDPETLEKNNQLILLTDPKEIRNKINQFRFASQQMIIICTYQSSGTLIQACEENNKTEPRMIFDLGIFDEAHKTVGRVGKQFSQMILDGEIMIRKRLFMTATPKMYGGAVDQMDDNVLSMDNERFYGRCIYQYNTGNAIVDQKLTDYQLVTMCANDQDIERMIIENKLVSYKKEFLDAQSNYLGTILMMLKKIDAGESKHLVTFHNTVVNARDFAKFFNLINQYIGNTNIYVNCLDGKHSMSKRKKIIKEFSKADRAIICSARVLNEGINIPVIDAVCFVDPRKSTVDIVQCIGRALRLYPDKKIANVYIPVFVKDLNDETLDHSKVYGNTIRILKAMKSTDEGIVDYFRLKCGGHKVTGKQMCKFEAFDMIDDNSEEIILNDWINGIGSKIWAILDPFETKYKELKQWIAENNRIPSIASKNKNEKQLGKWCSRKRRDKKINKLSKDKIIKLELLEGWYWDQSDKFNETYEALKQWIAKNKKIPSESNKNKDIKQFGLWCSHARADKKKNKLSEDRIAKFELLDGWYWNKSDIFDETYEELKQWIAENNRIPSKESKNKNEKLLGSWCSDKRKYKKKHKLAENRIDKLELLDGWYWGNNVIKVVKDFDETYEELKQWISNNNRIPSKMSKNKNERLLGLWCGNKRTAKKNNKISENRIIKLESLNGWYWGQNDKFDETYEEVTEWITNNNKIPSSSSKNRNEKHLGSWCSHKRKCKKNNKLSKDKIAKLELLDGWYWDGLGVKINNNKRQILNNLSIKDRNNLNNNKKNII